MSEPIKTKNSADVSVVILAAGQGKRMRSATPKVLQLLAGKSLLAHVIQAARDIHPQKVCVVYGHAGDQVRATFADNDLAWAKQEPQLGTGHAVLQALPQLPLLAAGLKMTLVCWGAAGERGMTSLLAGLAR